MLSIQDFKITAERQIIDNELFREYLYTIKGIDNLLTKHTSFPPGSDCEEISSSIAQNSALVETLIFTRQSIYAVMIKFITDEWSGIKNQISEIDQEFIKQICPQLIVHNSMFYNNNYILDEYGRIHPNTKWYH